MKIKKQRQASRGEAVEWVKSVAIRYDGDECLTWPFLSTAKGYPTVAINRKMNRVNRFICSERHGLPPTKKHHAAHNCGNKECCNPNHIRWATPKDNLADRHSHGTMNNGVRNGNSKLNEQDVLEIRRLYFRDGWPLNRIAGIFDIHPTNVSLIINRKTWGWL